MQKIPDKSSVQRMPQPWRERKPLLEGRCRNCHTFQSRVPGSCNDDGKSCHRTDYDRINEMYLSWTRDPDEQVPLVCAAAAAIGALPSPDSFEKIPLAIPFCIATIILPIAPPASALPVNADFTIVTIAAGIAVIFVTMIMICASTTYRTAMNGTTISDTFAILLIPPKYNHSDTYRQYQTGDITVAHE